MSMRHEVLARAGNPEKVEEDKNKVREYVMDDLFERAPFVGRRSDLRHGGVLHKDFLKNCRSKIADGALVQATNRDAESYMNTIWSTLVKDNSYSTWLSMKRSSRYQAMQDKFESE